ncbi:unnamed protein product [Bursaphelenchus xylophilus]|uniref:(pine wood nematode) hypothetical protein n=1 Tax=Bursaphelenchus xylophilus TaxID=6326 RepID=A0A1I7RN42_BURXY|nr:unnamed protein product [Bursaphelenchus xylophilus]CAG9087664.1 unnamed protein product [Bursaphelenchus xylophilus]
MHHTSLSSNFLAVAQENHKSIRNSCSIASSHQHFKFLSSSTSRQMSTNYGPQLQQQHTDHKGPPFTTSETEVWTTSPIMNW